ncbi:amino acid adenylation domain-containing protein [Streptomyces microflavus]|uniref:amino acid adenylation domain-containing protein n=1 Tax=Streptomyces microflavus TaxID=1919 RepID=UPI00362D17E1
MSAAQGSGAPARAWADLPLAPGTVDRANSLALRRSRTLDTSTALLDHVIRHAENDPGRTAVVDGKRVLTYRSLVEDVGAVRSLLLARGIVAGDVVATVGTRSLETPVVFLALESIGASYLPVDPTWPAVRVRDVLGRAAARLLLDYTGAEEVANAARSAATSENVALLVLPSERHCHEVPRRGGSDRSHETRYTIFTSGTTGHPKGATVEHQGMLNHLWAKVHDLSMTPQDSVAFTAPLVFDISIWQMLCPLLIGGRTIVISDSALRLPRWLIAALDAAEVSVVELVPTVVGWLVDEVRRAGGTSLTSLRRLLSTGEELHPGLAARVLDALPDVAVINAYGPTECSDDITHHVVTEADLVRDRIPVGSPVDNTSLYLLVQEEDSWRAAGPGETGELFVGGLCVGLGYLNDLEVTGRAFFRDPFDPVSPTGRLYRTGDLASFDAGLVHYSGRSDRQVKVAGVRMELDEIEAVLSRHPGVERCAVVVSGDGDHSELVGHYSVLASVSPDELQKSLDAVLPSAMVPRRWQRWDALPLTQNGKIDHRALRAAGASSREETS